MEAKHKCPECGHDKLKWNKEKGEIICKYCGLVLDDKLIDFTPEWREFDEHDQGKRRTGAPVSYLQPGIFTQVGTKSDMSVLSSSNRNKFFRLRKWQNRTATAIERNLQTALSELKRLSSSLVLPKSTEEEAARIYTLAVQRGLVKGRGIEKMVAATIYMAAKLNEIPKTLKEISDVAEVSKKDIAKSYKFISRRLNIKVLPNDPIDFISKISSQLGLSEKTQTQAIGLLERAKKKGMLSGKNPGSIAAAVLYASAKLNKEKKTQQQFSEASKITEVTLRNRFQEMVKELDLDIKKRKIKISKKRVYNRVTKKALTKSPKKSAHKVKKSKKSRKK